MKPIIITILVATAAVAGWFAKTSQESPSAGKPAASGERKIAFYQSAMHPWIKSDKPGRCTICGMELTPVYEGEKGFDSGTGANVVSLTQSQIQVVHVQTAEAKKQPLVRTLHVAGTVDDDERRHRIISAYVDGRIDKLFANHHGVEVVAGQPLALLYSPALLQAEREYRQLSGDLKKNTGLRLLQMGLTQQQIEGLASKPEDALSTEILAPLTGTVVEHEVYEGQYVKEGEKLFAIADFNIMWFLFRAYEQDMPWIKLGQEVAVTTPSVPGKSFIGKVTFIDPNFDEATRSTPVRVEIPNPVDNGKRALLHRLYADGFLKIDAPEVLAVPRSTVIQTGNKAVVYVDHGNGSYEQRPVTLGRHGDDLQEIVTGLTSGERVVSNGSLLIDGQAEMNRSFSPEQASGELIFTDARLKAVQPLLTAADSMAAALAASDLAAFNKASEPVMELTENFTSVFKGVAKVTTKLDALTNASHLHGFDDLKSARIAFHKFATASTELLQPLRREPGAPVFKVWECFMVDQIVPGVPEIGRWLQVAAREGQNPYFGKSMLNCAKEINPGDPNP